MSLSTAMAAQYIRRVLDQDISKIALPLRPSELAELIGHLRLIARHRENGWAYAMRAHFEKQKLTNDPDHRQLLNELSSQAADDAGTMTRIVGIDATILLLRYFNQNHENE